MIIDKTLSRFFSRVSPEPNSGCWLWSGPVRGKLYGAFGDQYAHRFSYRAFVSPVPDGHDVCHHCDNTLCVNPAHLFAGTRKQNIRDMIMKRRASWQVDPPRASENGRLCPKARGEEAGNAKLTERDVFLVRRLADRGVPSVILSEAFGVSQTAIRQVAAGKSWRHVNAD